MHGGQQAHLVVTLLLYQPTQGACAYVSSGRRAIARRNDSLPACLLALLSVPTWFALYPSTPAQLQEMQDFVHLRSPRHAVTGMQTVNAMSDQSTHRPTPCPAPCCVQTIELPDANERAAIASDPLASLERQTLQARKAASGRAQLVQLSAEREAKGRDPYSLNKTLRAAMRQTKKADAQLVAE